MADEIDVEAMLEAPFRQSGDKENDRRSSHKSSKKSSSRHRSRSRERKRRHRSRSRDRDRSRSRRHRSRERKRSRSRGRRSRSWSRERRERDALVVPNEHIIMPQQRSPSPPDRDSRTVFCMQLSQRIRSRDLEDFFSAVGTVRDVKLIADKHSKRSKGIAYVEFKEMESVPLALGLSGQKLLGVPMIVQPSQAEKNRVAAAAATNLQRAALGPTKLYVSELHQNITEEMLKGIFTPFGRLENVQLIPQQGDEGKSGCGFITFHDADAAKKAMTQLNGFEIAGKAMSVTSVTDPSVNAQFAFAMLGGQGGPSFLDNEVVERGGIDLGTTGRLQLMAKLAEGTGLQVPQVQQQSAPPARQESSNPPIATTCFQLTNMFDPKSETDPMWKDDIKDDVIEECSNHGKVLHVFVDENSEGNVYVKCDSSDAAAKSVSALHGRYFAGKMITAAYVPVVNYHALFPDSLTASIGLRQSNR